MSEEDVVKVMIGGESEAKRDQQGQEDCDPAKAGNRSRVYPPLARQTRISGTVRLHAIIGKDGTVHELEVMNGHPLLVQAALEAVRQWRYKPTLLNGEPVEVDTTIDVIFSLNQ